MSTVLSRHDAAQLEVPQHVSDQPADNHDQDHEPATDDTGPDAEADPGLDEPDTTDELAVKRKRILDAAGAREALDKLPEKENQATRLVALAQHHYRLVKGTDGRLYATAKNGPAIAHNLRGRDGLRQRLARLYFDTYNQAPGGSGLADALTVLEGHADSDDPIPVALRVAQAGEGRIVLDLGRADGRCVLVDAAGWRLAARSPVLFRRSTLTGPLPDPVAGGTLDGLRALLNVDEARWRLVVGWLVAALMPGIPHPILALIGEQGTAKTTAGNAVVGLVDPSVARLGTPPAEMGSWAALAAASWVVGLDNVSTIPPWFSDTLCKAVTGDGIVTRALFTDDDLNILTFRRCIVLTTIDAGRLAGDLAERLLPIELDPITRRLKDADVAAAYDKARPEALGALLDLTAAVLAAMPAVEVEDAPRMADFAHVLAALDTVCGWASLADYRAAAAEANQAVLESSPVAEAVMALLGRGGAWRGTPGELLDKITPDPRPRDWPRNARGLTGQLKRLAPALRANGITIERPDTRGARRVITLRATPDGEAPHRQGPETTDATDATDAANR